MHSATESNVPTPIFDVEVELMGRRGSYKESLHAMGFRGAGAPVALHDMNRAIALIGRDILNKGVLEYDGPNNHFLLKMP